MTNRHRRQWEALGRSDPYWAVLTDPAARGGRWDRERFFASGEAEIVALVRRLGKLGIHPPFGRALDYGCGVGRLTRALAKRCDAVVGVDIADSMLQEARQANPELAHVDFERGDGHSLEGHADSSFDLIYCNIVLQHASPSRQLQLVDEFCRVLRPGGALVFQTPDSARLDTVAGLAHRLLGNRLLNLFRRLRFGRDGVMEIHCLPREQVETTLKVNAMELLAVDLDRAAGVGFHSWRYLIRKPSLQTRADLPTVRD